MMNNGGRDVPRLPPEKPGTHSEIRVIAEGEEVLIEASGLFEHFAVIERRTRIGPEGFLGCFELPDVFRHGAAPTILAVPVDEVPRFVDDIRWILQQDLAGKHADAAL